MGIDRQDFGDAQQCGMFDVSLAVSRDDEKMLELKLDDREDSFMIADLDADAARELARKLIAFAAHVDPF